MNTQELLKSIKEKKELLNKTVDQNAEQDNRGYELDLAIPEATMQNISKAGSVACAELYMQGRFLAQLETLLKLEEGRAYIEARKVACEDTPKPTEGHITAVMDSNADLAKLRKEVAEQKVTVSSISKRFDQIHGDRRMLLSWYQGQCRVGME